MVADKADAILDLLDFILRGARKISLKGNQDGGEGILEDTESQRVVGKKVRVGLNTEE